MNHASSSESRPSPFRDHTVSRVVLFASAMFLAACVLMRAGDLPVNPAYAGTVSESDGITVLTGSTGRGKDADPHTLLYVIDNRTETLLIYEIEDARRREIFLRHATPLPGLFIRGVR
jgi:type II secretory ATPase GspE/PulE/Tfp pilus assembly ATPase PilB-like protein